MDEATLAKARDYALTGGGSGYTTRHERLVMAWGFLRGEVAKRVNLRYMPELRFREDTSFEASSRIDELLADQPIGGRPLLLLGALLFLTGIILVNFGLMGELLVRTWHESQGKPIYVVQERRPQRRDETAPVPDR